MRSKMACRLFSELSQVQLKTGYCDHRGLYCRDDTAFVVGIVKSMGAASPVPTAIFSSSGLSATSQAASGVVDGITLSPTCRWSQRLQLGYQQYNQFRTDVAAAGEWGMSTQTRDGSMVWDSGGAMSKLPVDINVGRQIASAQQQMAREADVQPKARCMAITAV